MDALKEWEGRQTTAHEVIERWPLNGLATIVDERSETRAVSLSGALHPCAHWLYFVPTVPRTEVDVDGHPKRGKFIPPLPHARRMWAKSVITYYDDIHVGDGIAKTSTISRLDQKVGKSGELVFLTIGNQYSREGSVVREEEQTLVYRDHQDYDDGLFNLRIEHKPDWSFSSCINEVDLFRYSAVTFNGHRIHYDSDYTRNIEKYPAIIVQGQLIATLVLSHALDSIGAPQCTRYTFKAVKPLFVNEPFYIEGRRLEDGNIEAWARQKDGRVNMTAEIIL